ncbi:Hsp70 family protein [Corynebacterium sp. NPDC060344]|uniref:RCC1 domain-containing protein n=1 Tax=Corynebacterium sp. NPDC060344 TaxID=3347101 RepID=UPI0036517910
MVRRLALDIGATTVTARLRGGGGSRATVLFDGSASAPAAVCFEGPGACAGVAAIAAGAGDPSSFAAAPLASVMAGRLRYGGVDRDPAELVMPVLSMVLGHAADIDAEPPEQVVCVVPLGASDRLRAPVAAAARSLGLPEPALIPEPVAALLHATGGRGLPEGGTGVIVDAGGSSMEVTVLRGTGSGAPEVLADRSDRALGGDDVDVRILAWLGTVLDHSNPPLSAALRAETNRTLLAALRAEVRRAKEDLASMPETDIAVTTLHGHGSVRITRADLDRILADWSSRARALVSAALADAGLRADGSVGCFVIGGGASLPTLHRALAPVGRLTVAHEPLTAAADGAAIADDAALAAIGEMDEEPRRPVAKQDRPSPAAPFRARTMPAPAPAAPAPASPFARHRHAPSAIRRIWAGKSHVVAEDADGVVWHWGELGLLGLFTKPSVPRPVAGVRGPLAAASAGDSFSVAVDARGRVTAWGSNDSMKLGVADAPLLKGEPTSPALSVPIIGVSCGDTHTLAITADGHVMTWGSPLNGRLGHTAAMEVSPQPPLPVAHDVRSIVAVVAGQGHSLALDDAGALWGWGRDNRGQLSGSEARGKPRPMLLPTAVAFEKIAAGRDFTLALDGAGTVWSWGRNDRGQLGLGAGTRSAAGRVQLPGPAVGIFAANAHAGAILTDGTLFLWGSNNQGQLGMPGGVRSFSPVPRPMTIPAPIPAPGGTPPGSTHVTQADGGDDYTVCLTASGTVFAWGTGFHGIDGSGSRFESRHVPVRVCG